MPGPVVAAYGRRVANRLRNEGRALYVIVIAERVEPAGGIPYLVRMRVGISIPAVAAALLLATTTAPAQADNFVGTFGKWNVQTYKEGGGKVCLMWSQPTKSEGNYTRRGDVYTYVTQRPAKKRLNEISISIGYPFKKESALIIAIGKTSFKMFSQGDTAWNRRPAGDAKMIKAMQAGATMTARGVSSRGTKTTDIFSLKGFTKAYAAMNRSCGIGKKKR